MLTPTNGRCPFPLADRLLKRDEVEAALSERGVTMLQALQNGIVIYTYHGYPGGEFPLMWIDGCIARESLLYTLEAEGIDTSDFIEG